MTMATVAPRILTVDTGSLVQVVLNDQTQNHCVVFTAVPSNSLGVGLSMCSIIHLMAAV